MHRSADPNPSPLPPPRVSVIQPLEARVVSTGLDDPAPQEVDLTLEQLRQRFRSFHGEQGAGSKAGISDLSAWRAALTGDLAVGAARYISTTEVVSPAQTAAHTVSVASPSQPLNEAAVLIPLIETVQGLAVLLTVRTQHLKHHAGQISFPGGRREPGDADAVATALREAWEEVGIEPSDVEVLGQLPPYRTSTDYSVTPVVGHCTRYGKLDTHEVASAFLAPLAFLMNPAHHELREYQFGEVMRRFYAMPWQGYFIWGATAAMLRNFYQFLLAPLPQPREKSRQLITARSST